MSEILDAYYKATGRVKPETAEPASPLAAPAGISTPEPPELDLRVALEASSDLTAAKVAQYHKWAEELGLPEEMIPSAHEVARREVTARKLEATPLLAQWAGQSRTNAALASEDAESLVQIFDKVHRQAPVKQDGGLAWWFTPQLGAAKSVLKTAGRLPFIAGETILQTAARIGGSIDAAERHEMPPRWRQDTGLMEGWTGPAKEIGGYGQAVSDFNLDLARRLRKSVLESDLLSLPPELRGRLWDNLHYLKDPEYLVFQGGEAVNSLAIMLLGTKGLGGGTGTMAAIGGLMEAGGAYQEMVQDGAPIDQAWLMSGLYGVVSSFLNKIGLESLFAKPAKSMVGKAGRVLAAGATEGVTEYLEEPAQAFFHGLAKDESLAEIGTRVAKSLENIDVIPGAFIAGAGGHALHNMNEARKAQAFRDAQVDLHTDIEATNTKQLSPAHMVSALEAAGLREEVALPAEELLTLYQNGQDILTPLGLTQDEVTKAAAAGQAVFLPLSQLHARLNQDQFQAAANIMRRSPEAFNAAEAEGAGQKVADNTKRLIELYQDHKAELDELDVARAELRTQAVEAINSVPGLRAQAEAAGGVERYVDSWLKLLDSFSRRMLGSKQNPADFFRRLALDNLRQHRRANLTPEQVIADDLAELGATPEPAAETADQPPAETVQPVDGGIDLSGLEDGQAAPDAGAEGQPAVPPTGTPTEAQSVRERLAAEARARGDSIAEYQAELDEGPVTIRVIRKGDGQGGLSAAVIEVRHGDDIQLLKGYANLLAVKSDEETIAHALEPLGVKNIQAKTQAEAPAVQTTVAPAPGAPQAAPATPVPSPAQGPAPGATGRPVGRETTIISAQGQEAARYEVWEASDLIPSHRPESYFAKREDYPANVQERPYHSDRGEQDKVRRIALNLTPDLMLTDNPDAVNGPPIVTEGGVVLGGNGRAMSLQLAYAENPQGAARYREALAAKAQAMGIDPAAVAGMENPVLVRVVGGQMDEKGLAVRSRLYNQSQTQGIQSKAEGVSKARLISQETLEYLAANLGEDETLRAFLDSAAGKGFIETLKTDGVLEQTQLARLTDEKGWLNEEGKALVENALRGLVVADYDVLRAVPASVLNKLDRAVPALARLKARGQGWDMGPVLTAALRQIARAEQSKTHIEDHLAQMEMFNTDPDKDRPAVQILAMAMTKGTQKEVAARFEAMAQDAEMFAQAQGALIEGPEITPASAFIKAFLEPVATVGGEVIGGFDPAGNQTHAALEFAYKNGGKGRTVAAAIEKLQKGLAKQDEARKAKTWETIRALNKFSGAVAVFPPKKPRVFDWRPGQELFQIAPTPEQVKAADEALAEDVAAWGKSVDDFLNGSLHPRQSVTMLQQTPLVLQMLGAKNLPILTSLNVLKKTLVEKHNLSPEIAKQVPAAMTDPIMVFKSATQAGSLVMMLDLKDKHGATVIVPVLLEETIGRGYTANIATSIYGRANSNKTGPDNYWFVNQISDGNLLYRNMQKSRVWARTAGLQLPGVGTPKHGKNRILNEQDLVKYREGHPGFYQPAYQGSPARYDRPSLDFIGTGEGQQVHGWGLYYSMLRETAEGYRERLTYGEVLIDGQKPEVTLTSDEYTVRDVLDVLADEAERVDYDLKKLRKNLKADAGHEQIYSDALQALKGAKEIKKNEGQLYKVDLPEDSEMMTEHEGLEHPSNKIILDKAEAIKEAVLKRNPNALEDLGGSWELLFHPGALGEDFYGTLSSLVGGDRAASLLLNEVGIKGIRYEGQRDGPCCVIFDDAAINILETYYQAQAQEAGPQGSLSIVDHNYLIRLFQTANLSTLIHETGHIFLAEIERIIRSGQADESLVDDFRSIVLWQNRLNDDKVLREEYGRGLAKHFGGRAFKDLDRAEKDRARELAKHEYFARGFEAYLAEGRAPSRELEGVFSRFKKWLVRLYLEARQALTVGQALGVELTPEIRDVFDRLLAVESEIAATAARNEFLDLTAKEMDALGLDGELRTRAAGLMDSARTAAAEGLSRDRNNHRGARLARLEKGAREILLEEPLYAARAALRRTPLDLEAVREYYGDATAAALMKKVPGCLKYEGGLDPEAWAAQHGFESGAALVSAVLDAPTLTQAIAERVKAKEAEHDAGYLALDYLLDTQEVGEQFALVGRKLAEGLGMDNIAPVDYSRFAEAEIRQMPMSRALSTGRFLADMRRALERFRVALASGDKEAALRAHRQAHLNLEFSKQSRNLAKEQERLSREVRRFIAMKSGDPKARFLAMDIAMRHNLAQFDARLAEGKGPDTFREWLDEAADDGYNVIVDPTIWYGQGKPWREMTVDKFQDLAVTLKQIVAIERARRQVETAKGRQELATVAGEINHELLTNNEIKKQALVAREKDWFKDLDKIKNGIRKIETLFLKMGGDDTQGALWQVYKTMSDAEDGRALRMKTEKGNIDRLFSIFTNEELAALFKEKFIIRSMGDEVITLQEAIGIALNIGNKINVSRLLESTTANGLQMTSRMLMEMTSQLKAKHWRFVQSVWDYLETFKKESFDLDEKINGVRPVEVEAEPFTVVSADGQVIEMRGGYLPIAYDAAKSSRAEEIQKGAELKDLFSVFNMAPTTVQGHLKARSEKGLGGPLRYGLDVIGQHVFNVVNDLTMREATINAAKILRQPAVKNAIEATAGVDAYRAIKSWLHNTVKERTLGPWEQKFAKWRHSVTIMGLGWKLGTMILQFTGLSVSVEVLGVKWMARGLRVAYGDSFSANPHEYLHRFQETYREVAAKSPFMAARLHSWSREVKEMARELEKSLKNNPIIWSQRKALNGIGYAQMMVDLPTWLGAYEQGLSKFGNEAQADKKRRKFDNSPTAELTGDEIFPLGRPLPDLAGVRKKLIDWLNERGWLKKFKNDDLGWDNISVSAGSIRDTTYHGIGDDKARVLAALPEIIKNGIYLEPGRTTAKGHKRYIFAAKAKVGGNNYAVGFVVEEDKNGRRFYDHELTEIKNLGATGGSAGNQHRLTRPPQGSVMNIVEKHLGVKPDSALDEVEAKAIAHADQAVRLSQGSGKAVDLAPIQSGGELERGITMFYSWFNTMANLAMLRAHEAGKLWKAGDKGQAAWKVGRFVIWGWLMTQGMEVVFDWARDRLPDDDEDGEGELAKYLAKKFLGFWTGMVPVLRDMAEAVIDRNFRRLGEFQPLRPATEVARTVGVGLEAAFGDDDDEALKKFVVSLTRSAGYASGTPTEPVAQVIKEVWDYMDGTDPELEIRKMVLR